MIKVLGKDEYLEYSELYKKMQGRMEGLDYAIDCPWILDNANITKDDIVLDIGCGSGGLGLYISKLCKKLYAVDKIYHPKFKDTCIKKEIYNAKFIQTNAVKLPCPDEYFDVAISVSALEHSSLDVVNKSVKEIARVLKPGRRLIATVATSPEDTSYFLSEKDIINTFTKGTGMKLVDESSLTGWKWNSEDVKNKLKEYLDVYGLYQNWIPVGVIVQKK